MGLRIIPTAANPASQTKLKFTKIPIEEIRKTKMMRNYSNLSAWHSRGLKKFISSIY